MKAVVCHQGALTASDLPGPHPSRGQVLLRVLRCGICGSDLHARRAGDELGSVMVESGYDGFMRADQQVVFGHEFVGEVAEYGPGCRRKVPTGTPVVAFPLVRKDGAVHPIGLSAAAPGGYAELVLVEESLMLPVPNGLPAQRAAPGGGGGRAARARARGEEAA